MKQSSYLVAESRDFAQSALSIPVSEAYKNTDLLWTPDEPASFQSMELVIKGEELREIWLAELLTSQAEFKAVPDCFNDKITLYLQAAGECESTDSSLESQLKEGQKTEIENVDEPERQHC